MNFEIIDNLRNTAANTYGVDPVIFIVIYVGSIPIFYYSLYIIGKTIIHLRTKHKLSRKEILKHREFLKALMVNQVAWIAPYLYVMFWGKNIPSWVWVLLVIYFIITINVLYTKLFNKAK